MHLKSFHPLKVFKYDIELENEQHFKDIKCQVVLNDSHLVAAWQVSDKKTTKTQSEKVLFKIPEGIAWWCQHKTIELPCVTLQNCCQLCNRNSFVSLNSNQKPKIWC